MLVVPLLTGPHSSIDKMDGSAQYRYFCSVPTRWMDQDLHGHAASSVCYAYFDTAICRYLVLEARFDIMREAIAPFTVENACHYYRFFFFPATMRVGLRAARIGRSSVRYEVALFEEGSEQPLVEGHFVDVFVDRLTHKAVPIPYALRGALHRLLPESDA